jgi:flagellar basal-body rod modification protein FlgD
MTTTTPVTTPSATTNTSTSSSNSSQQLAGNFQTFLKLLTTQLQNQDPTSPMDSNQFTQQLVMYSQVEQQINTNDNLTKLLSLTQNQTNNLAMSYIGKNIVLSDGTGQLTNGAANWTYGMDNIAANTSLTVKDSNGTVVYSKTMSAPADNTAGTHSFAWDGKDLNGNQLSDGLYSLTVSSTAKDGTAVKTSIASKAQVGGIDLSGTSPQLVIGSSEVPLASATLITN